MSPRISLKGLKSRSGYRERIHLQEFKLERFYSGCLLSTNLCVIIRSNRPWAVGKNNKRISLYTIVAKINWVPGNKLIENQRKFTRTSCLKS